MVDFSTTYTAKVSLRFLLNIGQYLGYFPAFHTYFRWKSWKTFYVILIMTSTILYHLVSSIWALKNAKKWSVEIFELILVRVGFSINTLMLFRLATKWIKVLNQWCHVDKAMNKLYGHPKHLQITVASLSGFFLVLGVIVFLTRRVANYSKMCKKTGDNNSFEHFLELSQSNIFWLISYSAVTALLLTVLELGFSLMPVYTDVFLIAISTILACRFQQLTTSLKRKQILQTKEASQNFSFWKSFRQEYCRLSCLLFTLDDHISPLIVFSYAWNFTSLLHFLTDFLRDTERNLVARIYNYLIAISFILRTLCLTWMSSWINEESQEPVKILNSVETDDYNGEVSRLLLQLSFDEVALTGGKMFKLNKRLLLSVISALVTYELMIIQYYNFYVDVQKNVTL